jgi:hypothetical protein
VGTAYFNTIKMSLVIEEAKRRSKISGRILMPAPDGKGIKLSKSFQKTCENVGVVMKLEAYHETGSHTDGELVRFDLLGFDAVYLSGVYVAVLAKSRLEKMMLFPKKYTSMSGGRKPKVTPMFYHWYQWVRFRAAFMNGGWWYEDLRPIILAEILYHYKFMMKVFKDYSKIMEYMSDIRYLEDMELSDEDRQAITDSLANQHPTIYDALSLLVDETYAYENYQLFVGKVPDYNLAPLKIMDDDYEEWDEYTAPQYASNIRTAQLEGVPEPFADIDEITEEVTRMEAEATERKEILRVEGINSMLKFLHAMKAYVHIAVAVPEQYVGAKIKVDLVRPLARSLLYRALATVFNVKKQDVYDHKNMVLKRFRPIVAKSRVSDEYELLLDKPETLQFYLDLPDEEYGIFTVPIQEEKGKLYVNPVKIRPNSALFPKIDYTYYSSVGLNRREVDEILG